jgi:hypothetical protein
VRTPDGAVVVVDVADEPEGRMQSGRGSRSIAAFSGVWACPAGASYLKGAWTRNDVEHFA